MDLPRGFPIGRHGAPRRPFAPKNSVLLWPPLTLMLLEAPCLVAAEPTAAATRLTPPLLLLLLLTTSLSCRPRARFPRSTSGVRISKTRGWTRLRRNIRRRPLLTVDQLRLTITLSARGRTRTLLRHTRGLGCHPSKIICRDRNPHLTITRHPTLCHLLRVCGPVMVHPVVACIAPSIWNTTCFPILSVRCSQSWLAKVMPLGLDWSAYKPVVDTIGYCYFSFLFFYSLFSFSCFLELFDIFGDALLSL